MFLGHFGLALGAKKVAPRPSLGTLVLAAQFADGLWPVFLLFGWETVEIAPGTTAVTPLLFRSYPYSHSLMADCLWAVLLGGGYYVLRRDRKGAFWIGALVISHWVLDFVSHRPDMPFWPGSPRVGLGLWYSLPATLAAEFLLFGAGIGLYAAATRARDRLGSWLLWVFAAVLVVLYLVSVFGPPPPSVTALAVTALLGWLFVVWAYWIDRHRTPVEG
jgi:membrane-bound metal-dependent hydrolase YbcI (DUF457 family)